mgnify:CR=1 FL=1
MQAPILPPNEVERLDSLRRMNQLYTPDEGALDSVTRTARLIFQTPIVLISLVDHNRQWFKSCLGLPQRDTLRDGVCALADFGLGGSRLFSGLRQRNVGVAA